VTGIAKKNTKIEDSNYFQNFFTSVGVIPKELFIFAPSYDSFSNIFK
jgi:hypothetical protein